MERVYFQIYKYTGDVTEKTTTIVSHRNQSVFGDDESNTHRLHIFPEGGLAFLENYDRFSADVVGDVGRFVPQRGQLVEFALAATNICEVGVLSSSGSVRTTSDRDQVEDWIDSGLPLERFKVEFDDRTVWYSDSRLRVENGDYMDILEGFAEIVSV